MSQSATSHRTRRRYQTHFTVASMNALASATVITHPPIQEMLEFQVSGLDNAAQQLLSRLPFQELAKVDEQSPLKVPGLAPWLKAGLNAIPQQRNSIAHHATPDESATFLCIETTNGRKRVYRERGGPSWEGWDMVEAMQTNKGRLINLLKSYILPQGYPESVAPQYASYMGWRGVQYFFGGAISVYTTKSLLGALGVAGKFTGEASAAINWVIKDGAGRLGRLLFARWGRELDCELKQFRLAGDLLMEGGAALELATIAAPVAFLPLACTANLAKNLAAVAASSTRAPIYRTFALQNNLADITAKGESVANLADILGTVAGILLSKAPSLPLLPTFCFLSAGYLIASRREVDSVELPYLNRARLGYSAHAFLRHGQIPGIAEANHNEPLLPGQGFNNGRILLGASVEDACQGPTDLRVSQKAHRDQRYLLTYRPDHNKVYIILREGATSQDCLRSVLSAHLLLFLMDKETLASSLPGVQQASHLSLRAVGKGMGDKAGPGTVRGAEKRGGDARTAESMSSASNPATWHATLWTTTKLMEKLYPEFVRQSEGQGWKLSQTMLNPKETRLMQLATPL